MYRYYTPTMLLCLRKTTGYLRIVSCDNLPRRQVPMIKPKVAIHTDTKTGISCSRLDRIVLQPATESTLRCKTTKITDSIANLKTTLDHIGQSRTRGRPTKAPYPMTATPKQRIRTLDFSIASKINPGKIDILVPQFENYGAFRNGRDIGSDTG